MEDKAWRKIVQWYWSAERVWSGVMPAPGILASMLDHVKGDSMVSILADRICCTFALTEKGLKKGTTLPFGMREGAQGNLTETDWGAFLERTVAGNAIAELRFEKEFGGLLHRYGKFRADGVYPFETAALQLPFAAGGILACSVPEVARLLIPISNVSFDELQLRSEFVGALCRGFRGSLHYFGEHHPIVIVDEEKTVLSLVAAPERDAQGKLFEEGVVS